MPPVVFLVFLVLEENPVFVGNPQANMPGNEKTVPDGAVFSFLQVGLSLRNPTKPSF